MPYFDGRCGRVFHDAWLPEGGDGQVRAAVVLLHGYGEHLGPNPCPTYPTEWPFGDV